ncbi:hypothetical protein PPYR_10254 [Photinus pyralis]|uniref:EF-hand domain-containing protein n=1 Tax=Photinus pyralis TaxID=7054 RepID=A0A5N4AFV9_PHOPY|nr:uncharacterized protein LOC116173144 [Photinus pyralis]KAB0796193.1 hypothetical protein PPYR_10254 [Photinus pyralis]
MKSIIYITIIVAFATIIHAETQDQLKAEDVKRLLAQDEIRAALEEAYKDKGHLLYPPSINLDGKLAQSTFKKSDIYGDGLWDMEVHGSVYSINRKFTDDEVRAVFKYVDTDENKLVSVSEAVAAGFDEPALKDFLSKYDANKDGQFSVEETIKVAQNEKL